MTAYLVIGAGQLDDHTRVSYHATGNISSIPTRTKTLCGLTVSGAHGLFPVVPLSSERRGVSCQDCRDIMRQLGAEVPRDKQRPRDVCPFCAWTYSNIKRQQGSYEAYWVECCSCQARGPKRNTKDDAVQGWNDGDTQR